MSLRVSFVTKPGCRRMQSSTVTDLELHRSEVRTSFIAIGGSAHCISHQALPDVPHQATGAKMSCRVGLSSSPLLPTVFPQQQPLIPPSSRRVGARFGVHTDYLIHEWTAAYLSVTGYRNDCRRRVKRVRVHWNCSLSDTASTSRGFWSRPVSHFGVRKAMSTLMASPFPLEH
jgi:hypothetical protein